jgi:hypothetical protein
MDEEIKKARQAARATFIKSERMNIRISPKDFRMRQYRFIDKALASWAEYCYIFNKL